MGGNRVAWGLLNVLTISPFVLQLVAMEKVMKATTERNKGSGRSKHWGSELNKNSLSN